MNPTQSGVFLLQNSIVLDFVVCTGVPIPSQIPISQNPAFGG